MRFLFIHQNFPAQFRHIACALADDAAHEVIGLGDIKNINFNTILHPRLKVAAYPTPKNAARETHVYLRDYESQVRRGQQVARTVMQMKAEGFAPDVVLVHPGWGEALFLREVFPLARHVHYAEYFYHVDGTDVGFDPEVPVDLDLRLKVRVKNTANLLSLTDCDIAVSPTQWQKSLCPKEFHEKIAVIHEGINTDIVKPSRVETFAINGNALEAGSPIVTYVARNLEPYRGFHTFIRALPSMQRECPGAHFLIVGGDDVSYGRRLPNGETYREKYWCEVSDQVDQTKIHFLGRLAYQDYLKVLQASTAHIYLTYPFILSWSALEAMASGCVVIGSATPPVEEVIVDGENGILTDFFDTEMLAKKVAQVINNPSKYDVVRRNAVQYIRENYNVASQAIPAWLALLTQQR